MSYITQSFMCACSSHRRMPTIGWAKFKKSKCDSTWCLLMIPSACLVHAKKGKKSRLSWGSVESRLLACQGQQQSAISECQENIGCFNFSIYMYLSLWSTTSNNFAPCHLFLASNEAFSWPPQDLPGPLFNFISIVPSSVSVHKFPTTQNSAPILKC